MKCRRIVNQIFTLLVVSVFAVGCSDSDYEDTSTLDQYLMDVEIIQNYIADNNLDAYDIDSTGVYIAITEEGTLHTDSFPQYTSTVTCSYKGYFTNGTVFDQTSDGDSITFSLQQVITGWTIAFPELTIGDKATILIPSYWGYGAYTYGSIPGNSVLIFDVELFDFVY